MRFAALARRIQDIEDFARDFSRFAITTVFNDETQKSLFKVGTNCHHPVDLPDTMGLKWREAIIRCLESVWP